MGSPGWAPLLLLAVGLCASGGIVCSRSPCWSTHGLLALHTARCHCQESSFTGAGGAVCLEQEGPLQPLPLDLVRLSQEALPVHPAVPCWRCSPEGSGSFRSGTCVWRQMPQDFRGAASASPRGNPGSLTRSGSVGDPGCRRLLRYGPWPSVPVPVASPQPSCSVRAGGSVERTVASVTQSGKLRQKRSSGVPVVPQAPEEETGPGPPASQPAAHRALCPQRKLLGRRCLSGKDRHVSVPCPDTCPRGLRSKRTQPWDPFSAARGPGLGSQRRGGPDFSFELLPEARVIRATVPPGPEVLLRLCHQWALECEEPSSPFDAQKIVSGGHTADLPYEFLLPCLCIEAFHLQEDTVRRKKCPFQSWPEAYGSDFWKSVHFSDYSQRDQMAMALTLRCPLRLEASLCQKQEGHTLCEDVPNATARESEGVRTDLPCPSPTRAGGGQDRGPGPSACLPALSPQWYILDKVDLHPQLCFKFSVGNSSHVECPHQTAGACTSWNVSVDTRARQLILHFSSTVQATFSAAWSHPGLGHDPLTSPVYSVSQTQGSGPVTLDLVIPFLRPGGCVLVWRSDVQFASKRLLCPGGPGPARPVLLLHVAESQEQRRLVGALAELLRTALGGGRDVIVDLWEGTRVAHVGPLPWLWAAQARVLRERGTVLLLWGPAGGSDPCTAPLHALLGAAPRPLLLLAYFSRLCAKGDIPRPLRVLPRYRLLRDLPRLLRALGARPGTGTVAAGPDCLGARQGLRGRLELCRRLEREAATVAGHV
ncbi:interleukin-17 receptor E isoform X5 [Oryctolagus cuniculus]|uniref:interleukin-17 receptor E isoform X5 n=1 Tax=Oryctolagus cuniculus TaxID=9986 RepID=UPI00387A5B83